MTKKSIYLFVLACITLVMPAYTQISVTLLPDTIAIGQQTTLEFTLELDEGQVAIFPVFADGLNEKIEIVNLEPIDSATVSGNNLRYKLNQRLLITSWEGGYHPIAPFTFTIIEKNDTLLLESEPVLLGVEAYNLDEQADLKDIKNIRKAPVTFAEIQYYIYGFILLLIIAWLLYRYFKNRKPKPVVQSVWEQPDIPAHVAALGSLENLRTKELWQQGKVKEYYSELTDIIRHYIEKRFGVGALEMTTSELATALKTNESYKSFKDDILPVLQLADLVKFAKHSPLPQENEDSLEKGFEFVHKTKKVENPETAKG